MTRYPKLSIVTPSYNQASFLERTIQSVLNQNYPNLEYIIVDGGSEDGSIEIIQKYADRLAWWVSEKDKGQAHAINKGLMRATGEWVAWQNSDDIYYPAAFINVISMAAKNPDVGLIIGNIMLIDEYDKPYREIKYIKPNYNSMRAEGMLMANQAAFWRRSVQDRVGLLDENYDYSFDYEWFLRLTKSVEGVHIKRRLGAFRMHEASKTSKSRKLFEKENKQILHGIELSMINKIYYKIKRLIQMLVCGEISYVSRGCYYRILKKNGVRV
jgi:glycosyltransferase involved in cell wall biosynthesis